MLIVIEGVDGSGKQTQAQLLAARLGAKKITFPNYDSPSSALVKMYLGGAFGARADDLSPYVASSFYAADRAATYYAALKADFDRGGVIVADRYTTSNAVHQAGKLSGAEKETFLDWLFDYEYRILGIPKPDLVIFLNMPPPYAWRLMQGRDNKITGGSAKDIHETDGGYLEKSYTNALDIAARFGWTVVDCVRDGQVREIEDINDEIMKLVKVESAFQPSPMI